jgi:cytochrome c peroxidase
VGSHVIDRAAAVALGKALFWDVQAGSDGVTACASCHFRAGADTRLRNTLNPGPSHVFGSGGVTSAGQVYTLGNITNDDRVGSSGVAAAHFLGISDDPASAVDLCSASLDPDFGAHRQVTGRQAPPAIAAVYNRDNFWDGRANHLFNSLDPFGSSTHPGAGVENASLASQAVGPALSSVEMSCDGRSFNGPNSLAAKLLARPPLQHQWVSPTDSVLGTVSSWPDKGIRVTYPQMIEAAFGGAMAADARNRFSHVWGEAIAAYEATLVPDRTPMDRYLAGDRTALTDQQQRGMNVFEGKGSCTKCHAGAETTDASVGFALRHGLVNEDGGDQGFHNIGVRPTAEDLGRAGAGPGGSFSVSGAPADRGAFKTPSLRNVGLTAPYFHNGGKATLMDVVDFYAAGGDFPNPEKATRMKELSLDARDRAELVDFLQNGLTDCRVAMEAAPFDHPSLEVADGPSLPATGAAGLGSCP